MKKLLFSLVAIIVLNGCGESMNSREFSFTYSVDLDSSNGKKIELWLPVPVSNEVQTISNLEIDADGLSYEIKDEKKHGNKYVYIFSNSGTQASKKISMSFDVARLEHQNVDYENVDPSNYLSGSKLVPVGKYFSKTIEDNSLNKNDMDDVYKFVLEGMHYGKPKSVDNVYYNDPWMSEDGKYGNKKVSRDQVLALYQFAKQTKGTYTFGNGNSYYACDIGVGNCTDYHSYFISLSRTLETPARFHMGFPIPSGDEGKVKGYHCWADYYVDGEGWYPVDISEADKDKSKKDYFFGTVDESRVEMMKGRDFVLDEYNGGKVNLFIYPLLEIGDKSSDSYSKSFSYKNL